MTGVADIAEILLAHGACTEVERVCVRSDSWNDGAQWVPSPLRSGAS